MAEPEPRDEEELLIEYVRQALDLREQGEDVDVAQLCRVHPELAGAVAEILGFGPGLGALRSAEAIDPGVGRVLAGRYRLDARIGRGAMGVVWQGTDLELQRVVAIKLFETLGQASASDVERFRREATSLATLQHDHVVRIHDRGTGEDGTLFLVMERLAGVPLSAMLEQVAIEPPGRDDLAAWLDRVMEGRSAAPPESTFLRAVVGWCADVASALAAAHAAAVFHRDVKPSNIFVRQDLQAVLLDFGIAARGGDPALTTGDSTLGTPWYMAPEQAERGERATAAIDVYGLCATLYHLATGEPPFDGDAVQVIARLRHDDPRPPQQIRPDLPRDLCAIIENGMERDPRRRYPTIAALESDLRAFLEHRPVVARPLGRAGRAWRRARRAPLKSFAIAAVVVIALLSAIVVPLWSSHAARARAAEAAELHAHLPALLAIEGQPGRRWVQDIGERGESIAVLNRLLELDPDDVTVRLWRAALRLDGGDTAAGANDLREVARRADDSGYVRAVAQAYLDAPAGSCGADAIEVSGLPEPTTPIDHYLAGLHELRRSDRSGYARRAFEHLSASAAQFPPAQDLLAIAMLARGEQEKDLGLFRDVVELTKELEGRYGRATARTLALRGAAYLGLGQFTTALPLLEQADALRPERHGVLQNLGIAWRQLGELDKARSYFERAHAMRPYLWNSVYMLALVHKDAGDFDRALALVAELPEDLSADDAWRRPELEATIRLRRAIDARNASGTTDEQVGKADAAAAADLFATAAALAPANLARRLAVREETARLVAGTDPGATFMSFANLLYLTPADPYEIANLATLLPERGIDADGAVRLRAWLRRLAIALAKGDPAFGVAQKEQLRVELNR